MKHFRNNKITVDYRHVCLLSLLAALVLAGMRGMLTPIALQQPTAYRIGMIITGVVLLAVLVLCAFKRTEAITVEGPMARVAAVGAAVTGATLLVFSVVTALNWQFQRPRVMPFPAKSIPTNVDQLFLYLLVIMGVLAGLSFLMLSVCWLFGGYTRRGILPLLSLSPVVWTWIRVIRYITSYASLVGLFHDLYDLATILFEMVFFVLLARYVSGEEFDSRFFVGVSLCTGVVCTVSSITQVMLFLQQNAVAFDTCALVIAPDFGVAILAFATAFAQAFGKPATEETVAPKLTVPTPPPEEEEDDPEDGEGAEFLLSDEWFTVYDPEEQPDTPD